MKRNKVKNQKKSKQLITRDVVEKCHRNKQSEEWLTIVKYCDDYAKYIGRTKNLEGFEEDLKASGLRSAAELIHHSTCPSADEVVEDIKRSINKEAQREYRKKGREFSSDHKAWPERWVHKMPPEPPIESKENLRAVQDVLISAMVHLKKNHPNYYRFLKENYITASTPPEDDTSIYTIRRAFRAYRESLLTVLDSLSPENDNFEILDLLKSFATGEVGQGVESFKKFIEDMTGLDLMDSS